jgi:hypothetical protein
MKNWYNLIPYTFFAILAMTTLYCIVTTVFKRPAPLQEGFSDANEIRIASCIYYLENLQGYLSNQNPAPPPSDFAAIDKLATKNMRNTLQDINNIKGPVTEDTYNKKLMPAIEEGLRILYGYSSLPVPAGSSPAGLLSTMVDPQTNKLLSYYYLMPGLTQLYDMLANKLTLSESNTY